MFGSRSNPKDIRPSQVGCLFRRTPGKDFYQWIHSVKITGVQVYLYSSKRQIDIECISIFATSQFELVIFHQFSMVRCWPNEKNKYLLTEQLFCQVQFYLVCPGVLVVLANKHNRLFAIRMCLVSKSLKWQQLLMSVKLGLPLFSLQAHYKVGGGNIVKWGKILLPRSI